MDSTVKEVVFSFDTTGSMSPCIREVRRKVEAVLTKLFKEVPGMRVGVIAHGDYCDKGRPYVTTSQDLTTDIHKLCKFVREVKDTGGGDLPECYELVLHQVRSMGWTSKENRVLVMIGDDVPHSPSEPQNYLHLDWKNEADLLRKMGVKVYSVQCLSKGSHATRFWENLAERTDGCYLTLDQFSSITDLLLAVCYQQAGLVELQRWEDEVSSKGRMDRSMDLVFARLSGRKVRFAEKRADKLVPVLPGRFQVMRVDDDQSIRDFVEENGLTFKPGHGFYEFMKPEDVQDYKEVVLRDNTTGDFFSGEQARKILRLPTNGTARIKPSAVPSGWTTFIQSTSYNRKLIKDTRFLYEVDLDR